LLSSYKSKHFFPNLTGITSIGMSTTNKQSKVGEDIEMNFQSEHLGNTLIPPSPVVKLDKRSPTKQVSKNSKASKSSSKKSEKNKKRLPRKYTKPNLSKEKLSNKSLATNNQYSSVEPLISEPKLDEDSKKGPSSSLFKSLKESEKRDKNKHTARLTIANATYDGINFKQGIIIEDQNESSDNSSEGSGSDQNSISSIHSSEPDHQMIPMKLEKAVSQQVGMKDRIFKNDNDTISQALGRLMKKDNILKNPESGLLAIPEKNGISLSS
jgi:hypothetical protein